MARILIIDDEPNVRSMLRRMLHQAGHQVSEAGNGAEGIDLYERDPPDLIITDILMPEKEGRAFRSWRERKNRNLAERKP